MELFDRLKALPALKGLQILPVSRLFPSLVLIYSAPPPLPLRVPLAQKESGYNRGVTTYNGEKLV